jgi:hypothetical protein
VDGNGQLDVVEARRDAAGTLLPERGFAAASKAIPDLKARFQSFEAYASATLADIYGPAVERAPSVTATTLEHMVFFNRGDHFEAVPLPAEAQFAPGFGVGVADFDGDGHDDVFMAQNFFALPAETPRYDAGRGLWLKGDGKGGLAPAPGQASGVKVYGDARGAALADFDADGRVDLVVTQNGAATRLFRNVRAQEGLRVRLAGPPGNLDGAGASIRLVWGERKGPAREVHAGSGYWSQDSAVQVMGAPERPTGVWVRWPGGGETTAAVPAGAKDVMVAKDGTLRVIR